MGSAGRQIGIATAAVVLLSLLAAPSLANAGDAASFFRMKVSVKGSFTVDYGEPPGPNNADYSGAATTSYSTQLVSVARYRQGEGEIDGLRENTKGRARYSESTSVVSHFPGGEPTEFECDNGRGSQASTTTMPPPGGVPQVILPFVRDLGSVSVGDGPGASLDLSYDASGGPWSYVNCFDAGHETVNHYLHSPDSSGVLLADTSTVENCCRAPRGAFNPDSDRSYKETFTREIRYEPGGNPRPESPAFPSHPGSDPPHEFEGSSSVTFDIDAIKEKKAEKHRKKVGKLREPDAWTTRSVFGPGDLGPLG